MSDYVTYLLNTIADIEADRAKQYAQADCLATLKELVGAPHNSTDYADKSDPDAMPTADDVAEMIVWADTAKDEQAFARFMERANGLLDRAYMSSRVGYAQSAIETAQRALAVARDDYATGEANHVIGEATRLIDRLNNSYAAAKGRY
ncbi:hypothetical protein J4T96_gp107 [Mycobacterium phage Finemlucis]|uniref:Uncharacterized protein n=1 Tax=Mycobacterium phage Finemlucis TaxID=2015844 RepID=A0A291IA13_9CAUD|nr:hypothetical protein J4T96_gp107 [Mycobacterium phage Finemlucis]ATG86541.1 hypothetical protein SEA_FINEMLUCIS_140 [Mycobacterium phage Finemlucis]QGZ16638.1 hypothetical protein PBI_GABRIELA_142 [Mycobacterium phage Gabriela]